MNLEKYELRGQSLPILTYPEPVLSQVAKPVTTFDKNLEGLVKNMLYTMYHAPGIGLAAPQIGEGIRLFVLDVDYEREVVTASSGKEEVRLSGFKQIGRAHSELQSECALPICLKPDRRTSIGL